MASLSHPIVIIPNVVSPALQGCSIGQVLYRPVSGTRLLCNTVHCVHLYTTRLHQKLFYLPYVIVKRMKSTFLWVHLEFQKFLRGVLGLFFLRCRKLGLLENY